MRSAALLIALVTSLSACSAQTSSPPGGTAATVRPGSTATSTQRARPTTDGTTRSTPTTAPGETTGTQPPAGSGGYPDAGSVGEMARSYLRASPATRLVIEIDYARGRRPSSSAVSHLESILQRECRKSGGVSVEVDDEFEPDRPAWTFAAIERLEGRLRDRRSGGSTAVMWLVYLNGDLSGEEGTLGVAYRASAAAIFRDRVGDAATGLVSPSAIERSVLAHETGHLLALVNIGYESVHDREDPDHPKHSKNKGSVMYWAIEDVTITAILTGGPPDDYDADDRDDLAFLRGS